jgi:hypothetical protein
VARLTEAQIEARRVHLIDQETAGPSHRYWLSFGDPDKAPGSSFLGVCIVRAHGIITASMEAHAQGCNPGGELQGFQLPDALVVDSDDMNRLLTKAECEALDAGLGEQMKQKAGSGNPTPDVSET